MAVTPDWRPCHRCGSNANSCNGGFYWWHMCSTSANILVTGSLFPHRADTLHTMRWNSVCRSFPSFSLLVSSFSFTSVSFPFSPFFPFLPSVLWRCWLGGRKGIRPVKNWVMGCCTVICLERGADLHMAQLMPLPLTVSCFSKIQIGFTFLVPAYLGSLGKRAVKRV